MLDYVIGSTDGFDNYRLTGSGYAFMEMLQRQTSDSQMLSKESFSVR
jgi:hypothetical protein